MQLRPHALSTRGEVLANAERCLLALPERPRSRRGSARAFEQRAAEEERRAHDWREELGAAGPVFAAAGLYWASRVDTLPSVLRRALTELEHPRFWPTPAPNPRQRLADLLGQPPESGLLRLTPCPTGHNLLSERFYAEVSSGAPIPDLEAMEPAFIEIQLARPELGNAQLALELLTVVTPSLETWLVVEDPEAAAELVDSARRAVATELDLERQAEAHEALTRDADTVLGDPTWDRSQVFRNLSNAEVLITEASTPAKLLWELQAEGQGVDESHDLAEQLCLAWLRQARLGSYLPAAPSHRNLALGPAGQLRVLGGGFMRPSPDWQKRLGAYLGAVATQEPDAILETLFDLLEEPPADRSAFRSRLRQIRPLSKAHDFAPMHRLASQLLLHWRWAAEAGGRPDGDTLVFLRGVVLLEQTLRSMAPNFDPWPPALEWLMLESRLGQWREKLAPDRLRMGLGHAAASIARWPKIVDSLAQSLEGGLRISLEVPPEAIRPSSSTRVAQSLPWIVSAALLILLLIDVDRSTLDTALTTPEPVRGLLLLAIGLYLGAARR
ncbi:MAG: AarF/UbiB family protein [Acidobacteriota bacterium]